MPTNITPAATWTNLIPTPDDGEGATGAGLDAMAQPLANREEWLHTLTTVDGVMRLREVANSTALKALVGAAEGDLRLIAGSGIYRFETPSITDNPPWSYTADDASGTWVNQLDTWVNALQKRVAGVDSVTGKVINPVPNRIVEAAVGILGGNYNNITTGYLTAHSKATTAAVAIGDKVIITVHGNLTAAVGAGACMSRLTVSENGGADIALSETEDGFDDTTVHRRAYTTVRTVATAGTFEARWQIKSGVAGKAASLQTPAAITLQVIRP